jgi:hypothetical protein
MRSIAHVNRSYWWWFKDAAYLRSRREHLLWIGRQEHLDLDSLGSALGLGTIVLPADPARSHRNPNAVGEQISEDALTHLRAWYAADYEFLTLCDELTELRSLRRPGGGGSGGA